MIARDSQQSSRPGSRKHAVRHRSAVKRCRRISPHFSAFASKQVKYDGQVFYGNDLTAVFGSVTCDLRNATISEDVIINANATFGGVEILVPENINVEIKSTSIFGGVEDKRRTSAVVNAPTVYVSGICLFGGVDIK